jgi:ParB-like chromosome segregation protein Spo0J
VTDGPQSAGLAALAERIELWAVDRLRPYERNPRTHSEAQVDQIAASMVEFGWTNPILIDENAGILAGHGRLLAARKLGLAEVPVIRFEHLTEAQKRAYILADNQIALQAGWDDALLAEELAWLRDERFDLDLTGFDASELERLLALADGESEPDGTEDEVPELPEDAVSKPGDLWVLGSHHQLDAAHPLQRRMARSGRRAAERGERGVRDRCPGRRRSGGADTEQHDAMRDSPSEIVVPLTTAAAGQPNAGRRYIATFTYDM